ncbi:MAG: hypothetical protein KKF88_01170 [Alphaproteobacteria bacterium]|nr:hypothetical protein [Alphaproteobacteria bacterium]
MQGSVQRLFKRGPRDTDHEAHPLPAVPAAGQIYSFRTRPYSEFAPRATDRYAAFKILGADDKYVAIAVLSGIWPVAPTMNEARKASIVNEHRLAHTGRPAVFGVNREWWTPASDLDEFRFVGTLTASAAERAFADAIAGFAIGSRFSTLHAADYTAEGEWRWSNDRDAFVSEMEQKKAKNEAERATKEDRYRNRLSKLTWDELLSETHFARWSPSPSFPPEEFTTAARAEIRSACDALKELGAKPRRAEVRAILKRTVLWFNDADEKAGGVIETEEREDICAVLEEMAHLARQKILVDEIDEWREW